MFLPIKHPTQERKGIQSVLSLRCVEIFPGYGLHMNNTVFKCSTGNTMETRPAGNPLPPLPPPLPILPRTLVVLQKPCDKYGVNVRFSDVSICK